MSLSTLFSAASSYGTSQTFEKERKKKADRKKATEKYKKERRLIEKEKEIRRKRRTVSPIHYRDGDLPRIPIYDEVNLETQIQRFPCSGENRMRIHNITELNGTFEISLDVILDCWQNGTNDTGCLVPVSRISQFRLKILFSFNYCLIYFNSSSNII